MRLLPGLSAVLLLVVTGIGLFALQSQAFQYGGYGISPYQSHEKAEFSWSRLRYNSRARSFGGFYGYGYGTWSRDYPKADRLFLLAMNRLTRIQGRSTEQVVDLDSDDIFNYPWVYAVQVQTWTFSEAEAKKLREYLLKGGFLMVDDFHGTEDWENFMEGMRMVFPDRPVETSITKMNCSIPSTILTTASRSPASNTSTPAGPTKKTATSRSGAPFATTGAASSWRFATTCIWGTLGNGPTCRSIRSVLRPWLSGSASTTSFME